MTVTENRKDLSRVREETVRGTVIWGAADVSSKSGSSASEEPA